MKQVKFLDKENDVIHGGILDDEGNVICGCCGGLIEKEDIGDAPNCTHKILTIYDVWINLDDEILGDDKLKSAYHII